MRRPILKTVLWLGVIGGFGSAFFHMGHCHHDRREAFERHLAEVCVNAARGVEPQHAQPGTVTR